jgi:hypothetical protein
VLKKLITCFVSPYSVLDNNGTYPAEEFGYVWVFAYVTVVGYLFF